MTNIRFRSRLRGVLQDVRSILGLQSYKATATTIPQDHLKFQDRLIFPSNHAILNAVLDASDNPNTGDPNVSVESPERISLRSEESRVSPEPPAVTDISEELEMLPPALSAPFFELAGVLSKIRHYTTEFHLFPLLPFELRIKIWHQILPPRIIHFDTAGAKTAKLAQDRIPVLFHINHESRTEALNLHHIPTGEKIITPLPLCEKYDTFLWTRYSSLPGAFWKQADEMRIPGALAKVETFAILLNFWDRVLSNPKFQDLYMVIRSAPRLRRFILVADDNDNQRKLCGKRMRLGPVEKAVGHRMRWQKSVEKKGVRKIWEVWDRKWKNGKAFKDSAIKVDFGRYPSIEFARICIEAVEEAEQGF